MVAEQRTSGLENNAREYRRLSQDRGGTSIERQETDNAEAAHEKGWTLGEPYSDGDRSASKYAKKERDDFLRLVQDIESGAFGAQILILWESSRGSRKVSEWARLIELCEEKRVKIYVTTHERLYNPANGRDAKTLHDEAADSQYESYKTHKRTTNTAALQAAKGRPHGFPPYGYRAVYNKRTGRLETWVENEQESIVPKELFRLIEAGWSITAIERKFKERGYVHLRERKGSPVGEPFTRIRLRDMATRVSYAGYRTHKGKLTKGTWDALVSEERFWAVQRIITAAGRNPAESREPKYVLSMSLKCDKCSEPMTVTRAHLKSHRESYKCRYGHVFIGREAVDDFVISAILDYLAREDVYELLTARTDESPEVRAVRDRLSAARLDREEFNSLPPAKKPYEALELARSKEALDDEIAALERQERELTLPPVLADALTAHKNIHKWWEDAQLSARREIAKIILTPSLLGEVRVTARPSGSRSVPAGERIVWRRERKWWGPG